jgi:hypothetical protein
MASVPTTPAAAAADVDALIAEAARDFTDYQQLTVLVTWYAVCHRPEFYWPSTEKPSRRAALTSRASRQTISSETGL